MALRFLGHPERSRADHRELTAGGLDDISPPPPHQLGPGPRRAGAGLTPPVGDVAANAHGLHEPREYAVLLLRPLLALQRRVVLLVLLQALEGAAARLRGQSGAGVSGPPRGTAEGAAARLRAESGAGGYQTAPGDGGEHPDRRPRATKEGPRHQLIKACPQTSQHLPDMTAQSPQAQIPRGGPRSARSVAKAPCATGRAAALLRPEAASEAPIRGG